MKLDRDRIQSILDEAGRSDLQIPSSVDGATVGVRVPAGVMAFYGNCGDVASGRMFSPAVVGLATMAEELPNPAEAGNPRRTPMPPAFRWSSFPARWCPFLRRSILPRSLKWRFSFWA